MMDERTDGQMEDGLFSTLKDKIKICHCKVESSTDAILCVKEAPTDPVQ